MGSEPFQDLHAIQVKFNACRNNILSVRNVFFSASLPTAKYSGALSIFRRNKTVTSQLTSLNFLSWCEFLYAYCRLAIGLNITRLNI